jgi:hypothetical protein
MLSDGYAVESAMTGDEMLRQNKEPEPEFEIILLLPQG